MSKEQDKSLNPRIWYILPSWADLPDDLRIPEVRPYYDVLDKHRVSLIIKRIFDVMVALVLIVLLFVPMILIAIAIKLDSNGPIFFRQERITTYGVAFQIHKFRTMVNDADKFGSAITVSQDQRITRVGAMLRDLRLDEFPQLIDVLEGNMSFVGTRPEVRKYVDKYQPTMLATLLLPAGITSEASICYKDEAMLLKNADDVDSVYVKNILPDKMEKNLDSIYTFNIFDDVLTSIKTLLAVFGKRY